MRDKERYQTEMENYRERIRANQVINDVVPIQQQFPHLNMEGDAKHGTGRDFRDENESNSSKSESVGGEDDDDDDDYENFSDAEASLAVNAGGVESGNINAGGYAASTAGDFQVVQADEKGCEESEGSLGIVPGEQKQPQHHNTITSMT